MTLPCCSEECEDSELDEGIHIPGRASRQTRQSDIAASLPVSADFFSNHSNCCWLWSEIDFLSNIEL